MMNESLFILNEWSEHGKTNLPQVWMPIRETIHCVCKNGLLPQRFICFFCGILWQTQCLSQQTICLIWRHVLWRYQYLLNLLEKQFESQCERTEVSKDISIRINYRDTQKSYGFCFFFRRISKLILIRPSFGDDTMSQGVHDTEK